ncbi:MAG: 4Fe-4S binding protein [Desulfobacterales bacterium]|nr:4Fe-4S binding protein [Desulfobacterales bacterium]
MGALRESWQNIVDLWSLIVGLKVTGKYFCYRHRTVHYPRKTVDNINTFRGPLELVPKSKDPTKPKCIVCMMCATNCPCGAITLVKKKAPKPTPEELKAEEEAKARGEKVKKKKAPKEPARFIQDFSLCSLCGICVENCPVGSIRFSNDVYFAVTRREDLALDLLARLRERAGEMEKTLSVEQEA